MGDAKVSIESKVSAYITGEERFAPDSRCVKGGQFFTHADRPAELKTDLRGVERAAADDLASPARPDGIETPGKGTGRPPSRSNWRAAHRVPGSRKVCRGTT